MQLQRLYELEVFYFSSKVLQSLDGGSTNEHWLVNEDTWEKYPQNSLSCFNFTVTSVKM